MSLREDLSTLEGKHFDVGISGVWYGANYGSCLTYYALYKTVEKMGYSILMIDKAHIMENDVELSSVTPSRAFAEKHYSAIAPSLKVQEMNLLNKYCDIFMMGCDQVWNYGIAKNFGLSHYFDFVNDDKKKVSYASSFGHAVSFTPPEAISDVTRLFHRFDAVSVRESDAVKILKNEFGLEATQVLDPVFLLEKEEYNVILNEADIEEKEHYLLAYILDPTPEIRENLLYAAEKKNLKLIVLLDGRGDFNKNKEIINLPNVVENLNPANWLWYFKNAEFVITDSCHGASFSLIFEKSFICIANKERGVSRFESLVDLFRIRDRLIYDVNLIQKNECLLDNFDYLQIQKILEMERERSEAWLKNALEKEKRKTTNISCVSKKECCGCGSCYNICPVDAICMEFDEEGFLYPVINEEKCIHCKKCIKACPSMSPVYNNNPQPECYAAYGNDDIREVSSSGGIFSLVADEVLKQGGAVCGAAFDNEFRLEQKVIYSQEEMPALRYSKYIQSNTRKTYKEIKEVLKNGKTALYVGCPCQVAGLKSYLGTDYEKLYTIDLLCHGGPSPKAFEKYLKEVHGKKKIEYIGFRDKEYFGWSAGMTVKYADGSIYKKLRSEDLFHRAFLPCLSVRPHCQVCNYSRLPRQGDLTLGDFWGVANYNPDLTDGKGTSIVSVNSEKGNYLIKQIENKLQVLKKIEREYILTHGQPYARPYKKNNPRRYRFHRMLQNCSFHKTMECCERNKFDFGILGMNADSYGEILSYYALYHIISSLDYSVLMVKRPREFEQKISPLKYRLVEFSNRYYPMVSNHESIEKINLIKSSCKCLIIADERNKSNIGDKATIVLKHDVLSEESIGLSPVLFADKKIFDDLINKIDKKKDNEYYVAYFSEYNQETQKVLEEFAVAQHCMIIDLSKDMPVEEWLYYFNYSKGVFTDLKEGIDFSIIFRKKYLVIQNEFSDAEVQEYVRMLGIQKHCCKLNEISGMFTQLTLTDDNYPLIMQRKKAYIEALQRILKKKTIMEVKKSDYLKKGIKNACRFMKYKTPASIKERLYPLLKNSRLYIKYLKRL